MNQTIRLSTTISQRIPSSLQNSSYKRLPVLFKTNWFLLAVALLLGQSPALADSYLRVNKNGVIYYYFNNREAARPTSQGENTLQLRGEAWSPKPSRRRDAPPAAAAAAIPAAPAGNQIAAQPAAAPDLWQILPEYEDAEPVNPYPEANPSLGAAPGWLKNLLTYLGFFDAPVSPPAPGGPQWLALSPNPPDLNAPKVEVPGVCLQLPQTAPETTAAQARAHQVVKYFRVANSQGYAFPVAGPFTFRDSWGDSRSGGRIHRAVDIFAQEGTPIYAVTTGTIQVLGTRPLAGIMLLMCGHDGLGYGYMHLQAYAPGIVEGKLVRAGELIGFVGTTGTFNSPAHLHFQVYPDHRLCNDYLLNPYDFLVQLCHGIGVTDHNQPRLARADRVPQGARNPQVASLLRAQDFTAGERFPRVLTPGSKIKWIKTCQPTWSKKFGERPVNITIKGSSILVRKNYEPQKSFQQ